MSSELLGEKDGGKWWVELFLVALDPNWGCSEVGCQWAEGLGAPSSFCSTPEGRAAMQRMHRLLRGCEGTEVAGGGCLDNSRSQTITPSPQTHTCCLLLDV